MWNDHFPRLINNPIIQRESIVRLRLFSSFIFLGAVLILGYLLMLANLYSIQTFNLFNYMSRDEFIRSTFGQFNSLLFMGICCLIPFLSAGAFNNEKERNTWDLVATTPLNYLTIYFGKFISSIFFVWIIFFSILPFYGIYFLSGSISFNEVFIVFAGLTEISILLAALGLLCSCFYKKTIQSVSAAFIISFFYIIILPYTWLIFNAVRAGGVPQYDLIHIISPLTFMFIFLSNTANMPTYFDRSTIIIFHMVYNSTLLCFLAITSIYLIYRKEDHKPRKIISDKRLNLNSQRISTFMEQFGPKPGFPDQKNPVMIKDIRMMTCKRWSNLPYLGILLLAFFIVAIDFIFKTFTGSTPNARSFDDCLFWLVFTPVFILPYAANCFRFEKDQDTYDLMLATNLSGEQITFGKFIAGSLVFLMRYLVFLGVMLLAVFLYTTMMITYDIPSDIQTNFLIIIVYPVISAVFFLTFGMYFSVRMKQTNAAFTITFLMAFVFFFGFMIASIILRSIIFQQYDYMFLSNLFCLFSPLWLVSNLVYGNIDAFRYISALNCFMVQAFVMIFSSIIFYYLTIITINKRNQ